MAATSFAAGAIVAKRMPPADPFVQNAVGTAVGGAVVGTAGSGIALAVGAGVFAVAAVVFVGLPRGGARASGGTTVLSDLGSGLGFVWRTRWLASTAALALLDTAACALDQALEAEAIMAREGLSTPGTRGPRAHPLCNVARDARNRLIASLRSLNLEL